MSVRLGIVMDPIASISYKKDSSLAMLLAAQARGWSLFYMEQHDLYQGEGKARARMRPLKVFADPARWFELGEEQDSTLAELDVILMRKDPPFDMEYVYGTYLLELAVRQGACVINSPSAIRDHNEKLAIGQFSQYTSPTMVTSDEARLRAFHAKHGDVIFKPLDGMGGAGIFRVKSDALNLGSIIETLTANGRYTIMAQKFIPAIDKGDKRVLVIGGKPVPFVLARIPQNGEVRGNLAAGGIGVAQPISERDREIAEALGPLLAERGLLLVGLDVIGENLTEVNVTSPTCFQEIFDQTGFDVAAMFIDAVEQKVLG